MSGLGEWGRVGRAGVEREAVNGDETRRTATGFGSSRGNRSTHCSGGCAMTASSSRASDPAGSPRTSRSALHLVDAFASPSRCTRSTTSHDFSATPQLDLLLDALDDDDDERRSGPRHSRRHLTRSSDRLRCSFFRLDDFFRDGKLQL